MACVFFQVFIESVTHLDHAYQLAVVVDDGLSGVPDEIKMGITYRQIHDYIRNGTSGTPEIDEKIARRERNNMHKRRLPTILDAWTD